MHEISEPNNFFWTFGCRMKSLKKLHVYNDAKVSQQVVVSLQTCLDGTKVLKELSFCICLAKCCLFWWTENAWGSHTRLLSSQLQWCLKNNWRKKHCQNWSMTHFSLSLHPNSHISCMKFRIRQLQESCAIGAIIMNNLSHNCVVWLSVFELTSSVLHQFKHLILVFLLSILEHKTFILSSWETFRLISIKQMPIVHRWFPWFGQMPTGLGPQ